MAALLGVTPQSVSDWTQGKRYVSGQVLRCARELGISVETVSEGFDLRAADTAEARRLRAEIKTYLACREAA
ncbi:MAG: hypothetical protein ACFB0C_24515 [Leptolyngbyaceae cyanobacterium]